METNPRTWLNVWVTTNKVSLSKNKATTQLINEVAASFELNQREAAVYLAALSSGARSVQAIALAANTERTGTYDVLERLDRRGLLRLDRAGKRTKVTLEAPNTVRNALSNRLAAIDAVLPKLTSLFEAAVDNFSVKKVMGEAALRRAIELAASGNEPLRVMIGTVSLADIGNSVQANIEALTPLFSVRKTRVLLSAALSQAGQAWAEKLSLALPCRRLPSPTFIQTTQLICGGSVLTVSLESDEISGVEVTSPFFVQHEQTIFDALWRTAK